MFAVHNALPDSVRREDGVLTSLPYAKCTFEDDADDDDLTGEEGTITTPVEYKIKGVYIGSYSTIVLTTDNQIWMSGQYSGGDENQLNSFRRMRFKQPFHSPITSISLGYSHQMILVKDENKIYICGSSGNGRLGISQSLTRFTLLDHQSTFNRNNLPVTHAKCGGIHSMIVLDNRYLFMAGWGGYGQHGQRTISDVQQFSLANPDFKPHERIKIVTGGSAHTIVVTEENLVYGCGCNEGGILGLQTNQNMQDHLVLLDFHKTFGSRPIIQVECGYRTTVFLLNTLEVYFIGANTEGEAGRMDQQTFNTLIKVDLPALNTANSVYISCGLYNTCISVNNQAIYLSGKLADFSSRTFKQIAPPTKDMENMRAVSGFSTLCVFRCRDQRSKMLERFFMNLASAPAITSFSDVDILAV